MPVRIGMWKAAQAAYQPAAADLGTATQSTRGERSADLRIGIPGITTLVECRGGALPFAAWTI
jgi:hypothetical protein